MLSDFHRESINRIRLEFKAVKECINRIRLEFKGRLPAYRPEKQASINRIRLEFKVC